MRYTFATLLLLYSFAAASHEIHPGGSESELVQLLEEAHETLENEGEGSFLQRWRDKFRYKEIFLNAYRWYSAKRHQPEIQNAAANIVTMLVTSHTIETVGGLTLAAGGGGLASSSLEQIVLTTVGVTITVPGLDPLCLVLVGAYSKWPEQMNRLLTKPRMFVVHGTKALKTLMGIPEDALSTIWSSYARSQFQRHLQDQKQHYAIRLLPQGIQFSILGGDPSEFIDLEFRKSSTGQLEMTRLLVSPNSTRVDSSHLKFLLRPFGLSISEFVRSAVQNRVTEENPFVRELNRTDLFGLDLTVDPAAFPLKSISPDDCENLLKS